MADLKELKVGLEEPKAQEDVQLPELPQWDKIFGRPKSLGDLDPVAALDLENIEATVVSLGDLAYLNEITETQITDNAVTAPKIQSISLSTLQATVGVLSAVSANLGTITAGSITGVTITGGTVRTSSSGARVQMLSSTNTLQILDSSGTVRAESYSNGWQFNNTVGSASGRIFIESTFQNLTIQAVSSDLFLTSISNISFAPNNGSIKAFFNASGLNMNDDIDLNNNEIVDAGAIELGGVRRTSWPSAGATTLSGLSINTTKNWGGYGITNLGNISFNGSGSYIDDLSALYFQSRTSNPSSPEGSIWFYQSGGTVEMRTYIGGHRYRFVLESI